MIDNFMYDIKHREEFLIGNNPDQYHSYWWNDGEPLWITADKQVYEDVARSIIGPILSGHSLSRVVVVVIVVVVVDIDFTLPFTWCRYCRTPPAL